MQVQPGDLPPVEDLPQEQQVALVAGADDTHLGPPERRLPALELLNFPGHRTDLRFPVRRPAEANRSRLLVRRLETPRRVRSLPAFSYCGHRKREGTRFQVRGIQVQREDGLPHLIRQQANQPLLHRRSGDEPLEEDFSQPGKPAAAVQRTGQESFIEAQADSRRVLPATLLQLLLVGEEYPDQPIRFLGVAILPLEMKTDQRFTGQAPALEHRHPRVSLGKGHRLLFVVPDGGLEPFLQDRLQQTPPAGLRDHPPAGSDLSEEGTEQILKREDRDLEGARVRLQKPLRQLLFSPAGGDDVEVLGRPALKLPETLLEQPPRPVTRGGSMTDDNLSHGSNLPGGTDPGGAASGAASFRAPTRGV